MEFSRREERERASTVQVTEVHIAHKSREFYQLAICSHKWKSVEHLFQLLMFSHFSFQARVPHFAPFVSDWTLLIKPPPSLINYRRYKTLLMRVSNIATFFPSDLLMLSAFAALHCSDLKHKQRLCCSSNTWRGQQGCNIATPGLLAKTQLSCFLPTGCSDMRPVSGPHE